MVTPWISTGSVRPTTSGTAHCWAARSGAPASRPWRLCVGPVDEAKTYRKPMETYGNLWKSPSFIDFMEKVGNIFKFLVRCALLIKWNREFVVIYGKFLLVQSPLFVAQTTQRCLEVFVGAEIDVGLLWISANHSTCSAGLWKVFRASQICRYSTDSTDSYSLL